MSPILVLALLATPTAPSLSERFQALAQAEHMVRKCASLDRSAATIARAKRSHAAAAAVSARARAAAAEGRRTWTAMQGQVDDSCIVGPRETPRRSYRDLLDQYERTTRDIARDLERKR
ncbi:hypothetical protein M9980_11435 [Sphingomonas donggukensis]|uniref:Lysozyme inhibitor LprI N-terminal domain-containing protein n=1 Tax=Sphingomonas donggukensis TaxID=2949093 RepID=A0ABY4TVG0_9SPHN|nr:hypothetical protein [Sphingomonas donggukensis]URW75154.1 hypothetical protein M9980_11435 [Sphingomonas donggukensis]